MHYKAPDNSLHFIEAEFAHLLPAGCVEITDEEAEALRPVPVVPPIVVSPRQIKQALDQTGLYDEVEAAVAAGNRQLKIWWSDATTFEENHPMVVQMALDLQVSGEQLHALFALAETL